MVNKALIMVPLPQVIANLSDLDQSAALCEPEGPLEKPENLIPQRFSDDGGTCGSMSLTMFLQALAQSDPRVGEIPIGSYKNVIPIGFLNLIP